MVIYNRCERERESRTSYLGTSSSLLEVRVEKSERLNDYKFGMTEHENFGNE